MRWKYITIEKLEALYRMPHQHVISETKKTLIFLYLRANQRRGACWQNERQYFQILIL